MTQRLITRVFGAATAVLAIGAISVGTAERVADRDGTVVTYFEDASPLEAGAEVRSAGVRVGAVRSVGLVGGEAEVVLDVERSATVLHDDATARIRPVNLLGEHYVDLEIGSPDRPLDDSRVIPSDRTRLTVSLQDVLDTFDDPTSAAVAAVVTSLGEGFDGTGEDVAGAITALEPALRETEALGAILAEQNDVLNQLVERITPVAAGLADDEGATLDGLLDSAAATVDALAAESAELDEAMIEFPATLGSARRTLQELDDLTTAAVPTLRGLRPVTDDLTDVSREIHEFADAADPALAALRPVLDEADHLLDQAAPAVADLRELGPHLRTVSGYTVPIADDLLDFHLQDLMDFVRKWSLSTNGRDGLSHYFRGVFFITPESIDDLVSGLLPPLGGVDGGDGDDDDGDAPAEEDADPTGPLDLDRTTDQLGEALDRVAPQVNSSGGRSKTESAAESSQSGGATGLSEDQERSLLRQLLGGS